MEKLGCASLSTITATAVAGEPSCAPALGLLRAKEKVSGPSATASSPMLTSTVMVPTFAPKLAVPVTAVKANLGESLGAAGAMQSVAMVAAMQGKRLPAVARLDRPEANLPLNVLTREIDVTIPGWSALFNTDPLYQFQDVFTQA